MRRGLIAGLVVLALGLVAPAVAAAQAWTWSGLGLDANWSTAANWQELSAPTSPADLTFPPNCLACTSTDDIGGLTVGTLKVDAQTGYAIGGNGITLTTGLATTASGSGGSPAINLPIDVQGAQNWDVSGGTVTLGGAVTSDPVTPGDVTLALGSGGELSLTGADTLDSLSTSGAGTLALGNSTTPATLALSSPSTLGNGTLALAIDGTGTNYSQLSGPSVDLSGTDLQLVTPSGCTGLVPGDVDTLISSPSVTGTFANASDGSLLPLCSGLDAQINDTASGVTATLLSQTTTVLPTTATTNAGQSTPITATVTPTFAGGPTPTGTVQLDDGTSTCSATLSGGDATCSLTFPDTGSYQVTATYLGDSANEASPPSNTEAVTVDAVTPTVDLTISPASAQTNEPVTLGAAVSGSDGTPTGTVSFLTNTGSQACSSALDGSGNASCTATFDHANAPTSIHAAYTPGSPTGYTASSSSPQPLTVALGGTVLVLDVSDSGPSAGENLTYTATVGPDYPGAPPSGTVSFTDNGGPVDCGAVSLVPNGSDGTATCRTTARGEGPQTITAAYGGDTSYAGSDSNAVPITVYPSASNTSLSLSPFNPVTNQSVTLTAKVSAANAPSGQVTFAAGNQLLCAGVALDTSTDTATCDADFAASSSPVTVDATFTPDSNSQAAASSTGPQTIDIAPAGTMMSLASSSPTPHTSQPVTYTATVTPAYPGTTQPLGTVAFSDNGAAIAGCTSQPLATGKATCTVGYPSTGSHTLTATYSGDANFSGSGAGPLSITVLTPPPTAVSATTLTPGSLTTKSAVLKGVVDTGGSAVTWQFQYGTRLPYTKATPVQSISSGHGTVSVSALLKLLTPATRYHVQLVVLTVGPGQSQAALGRDVVFTTKPLGQLALAVTRLRTATNTVPIPLRCAKAAACRGRLALSATAAPAHGHPARPVSCARVSYRIAPGRTQTVLATLAAGCLALARHKRLRLTASVTPQTPQLAFTRVITLVLLG